ncbi:unnamed protein product [Chondrus crispus]|uniref:Uncharacterized protein n=1 Tax=Chondrus crispus TaxID=2769 RepID=R7QQY4_CHOCR|nr:unnamed protein product [Chondrus crispus]CDF39800.1 unnamed protein product [Chondrus crispus]|eukprot:XP_005710094.1 unnamed protein product [Chondrus crispus]
MHTPTTSFLRTTSSLRCTVFFAPHSSPSSNNASHFLPTPLTFFQRLSPSSNKASHLLSAKSKITSRSTVLLRSRQKAPALVHKWIPH